MADNVAITAGSGTSIATDDIGGVQYQRVKVAIGADGAAIPGLFAAGEVAGFGGGGYHGYNALEGSFLGGCLFTGRQAGRSRAIA